MFNIFSLCDARDFLTHSSVGKIGKFWIVLGQGWCGVTAPMG